MGKHSRTFEYFFKNSMFSSSLSTNTEDSLIIVLVLHRFPLAPIPSHLHSLRLCFSFQRVVGENEGSVSI